MTAAPAGAPANSSCPRCGAAFRCGMVGGDAECWCVQLPHIMPIPSGPPSATGTPESSCFCPTCLQQISNERHKTSPAGD